MIFAKIYYEGNPRTVRVLDINRSLARVQALGGSKPFLRHGYYSSHYEPIGFVLKGSLYDIRSNRIHKSNIAETLNAVPIGVGIG